MKLVYKLLVAAAIAGAPVISQSAVAQATVTGSLSFGSPGATNYFNPANGFVPAGYGNTTGTTVQINNGVEFGFADGINTDTADFTSNSLAIKDVSSGSASVFYMSFTSNVAGFFNNAALTSSTFGTGSSLSLVGNTLTFMSSGASAAGTQTALINFSGASGAVPEPASWAMMILGMGAVGVAMRRRIRASEVKFDAKIKRITESAEA